jgi:hypothetical protein
MVITWVSSSLVGFKSSAKMVDVTGGFWLNVATRIISRWAANKLQTYLACSNK